MKNEMRLFVVSCAAAALMSGAVTAQTNTLGAKPGVADTFDKTVVAKGKGVTITRGDLDQEVIRIKAGAAAQNRMLPPDLEPQVLDGLVTRQLLLAKATDADKAKGKEQFQTSVQQFKTSRKLTDEEFDKQLSQQLNMMGMTKDQWEKQNVEQAIIPLVLQRELKIKVSDDEAKKYYDDNSAKFEQPEMVRAAHVLLMTKDSATGGELTDAQKAEKRKQIEDLLKRARAGEDFAKLAKTYSEDPGSKEKGGEYTFPRGQMVPEFEAAAFSLNTNQVSDVVTTSYGYHIIKLYEKIPAKKEAFSGAETKTVLRKPDGDHATISEVLSEQAMQKQVPDFIEKLKKDADVQITDEKLKLPDLPKETTPMLAPPAGSGKP